MHENTLVPAQCGAAEHDKMPSGLPLQALPMYFFIHIPKTGGTSLNQLLHRMFSPYSIFHGEIVQRAGGNAEIKEWLVKRPNFYDNLMLIVGHYGYRHPLVHLASRRRVILTVMREPIERIVSLYDYARRESGHAQHSVLQGLSLRQAINEPIPFRNNCLNAQILTAFGARNADDAKNRLRQENYVIGRFDHLERFLRAVERISGLLRPSALPHLNRMSDAPQSILAREQPDFDLALKDIRELNTEEIDFFAALPPVLATAVC